MHGSWSFAMVTPDAIVGGYLDLVLERLAAHGFEVRACRLIELDWPRLARMYHHRDDPPPPSDRDELPEPVMSRLYRLAPAAVLVVARQEGAAVAELLRCKGATRPVEAAGSSVRHAGEHLIFNLLHCPDDPESAAIELAYLVGREDAAGLVELASGVGGFDGLARLEELLGPDQLALCLPAFSGREAISAPAIVNRLRCRVVQLLAVRLPRDGEASGQLRAAHGSLVEWRSALEACATATERLGVARDADRASHEALAAAAARLRDPALLQGIIGLADAYERGGRDGLEAVRALQGAGIYLSALESVCLDAHAHAMRDPARQDRQNGANPA